jgi:hypothetical protein
VFAAALPDKTTASAATIVIARTDVLQTVQSLSTRILVPPPESTSWIERRIDTARRER